MEYLNNMKHLLISSLFLISGWAFGQEKTTVDFLPEIKQFDISELWTLNKIKYVFKNDTNIVERQEPLGYIGENYQRFYIHFISAIQSSMNTLEYYVKGKSRVKNWIFSFQGLITITDSKIYNDEGTANIKKGFVKGEYKFFEILGQNEAGITKGVFRTDFYLDKNGKITYDALQFNSDGFKNNQFEGIWTNFNGSFSIKCNWGDYRIPDSGDLDVGVEEFSVGQKYIPNGWLSYMVANGMMSNMDIGYEDVERKKWWLGK